MTDETHLDALIRGSLAELPMPDDHRTREALAEVLRRGRPRRATPRWLVPALAVTTMIAAVFIGSVASRIGAERPEPARPGTSLVVDTWRRDVRVAAQPGWNGPWEMTLTARGVLALRGPAAAAASADGASYAVSGDRLRVDVFVNSVCPELPAGEYAWVQSGDTLTLVVVTDPCRVRQELLEGTWRRSGTPFGAGG